MLEAYLSERSTELPEPQQAWTVHNVWFWVVWEDSHVSQEGAVAKRLRALGTQLGTPDFPYIHATDHAAGAKSSRRKYTWTRKRSSFPIGMSFRSPLLTSLMLSLPITKEKFTYPRPLWIFTIWNKYIRNDKYLNFKFNIQKLTTQIKINKSLTILTSSPDGLNTTFRENFMKHKKLYNF